MALKSEYAGTWQDANGLKKSSGFLELDKDGLKLRLIGIQDVELDEGDSLKGELAGIKIKAFEPLAIEKHIDSFFSNSLGGKCISLHNLSLSHSSSSFFDLPEETYYEFKAKYGLFGGRCITDKDSRIFTRARFHISDLHLMSSGSVITQEYKARGKIFKTFKLLRDGSSDVFNISEEGYRIEFYNGFTQPASSKSVKINARTNLVIVSRRGLSFSEHLQIYNKFDNLIKFLRGSPTILENTYLSTRRIIHKRGKVQVYEEFELMNPLIYQSKKLTQEDHIIIRLNSLENRSKIITRWMTGKGKIHRLISWFNFLWQNKSQLVETQLVEYTSLLEILSKSNEESGNFLDKSQFRAISKLLCDSLPEVIPPEIKGTFEDYIKRMNKKSQRLAISSYISQVWDKFEKHTDLSCEDFSRALSKNRNNISHGNFDDEKPFTAKTIESIFYLKEFAKYITYSLLAMGIGLMSQDIDRTIIRHLEDRKYNRKLNRQDFY